MTDIDRIARVVHEAVRALQIDDGHDPVPAWDDADGWLRDSTREGVQAAINGQTPRESHETWAAGKVRDGWVHGDVKDADAKTHPSLVDYDALPRAEQDKDAVLLAITEALHHRA